MLVKCANLLYDKVIHYAVKPQENKWAAYSFVINPGERLAFMKNQNNTIRKMALISMIAALYTVLSLTFAPLGFGIIQIRFSEALGLLAVFSPIGIYGVALGCLLSNAAGVLLGINIVPDILFGTLATLVAAWLTYLLRNVRVRKIPILSSLPPVLINALVIGLELTLFYSEGFVPEIFWTNVLSVGAGQVVPCMVLGLLMVYMIERTGLDRKLFPDS